MGIECDTDGGEGSTAARDDAKVRHLLYQMDRINRNDVIAAKLRVLPNSVGGSYATSPFTDAELKFLSERISREGRPEPRYLTPELLDVLAFLVAVTVGVHALVARTNTAFDAVASTCGTAVLLVTLWMLVSSFVDNIRVFKQYRGLQREWSEDRMVLTQLQNEISNRVLYRKS